MKKYIKSKAATVVSVLLFVSSFFTGLNVEGQNSTVHFNPNQGSWPSGVFNNSTYPDWESSIYWHKTSEDGIIIKTNIPPAPNPPTVVPQNSELNIGNITFLFGGWVTEYFSRQKRTQGGNVYDIEPNFIILTNGFSGIIEDIPIEFFVWSHSVYELYTPEENFSEYGILPPNTGSHQDEPTVYALWIVVSSNSVPTYLTFWDNIYDGNVVSYPGTILYKVNRLINGKLSYYPKNPIRQGYNFAGWDTDANGNGVRYASSEDLKALPTAPYTLYAQWTAIDYALVFDANVVDINGSRLAGLDAGICNRYLGEQNCYCNITGIFYSGTGSNSAWPTPIAMSRYELLGWNTDPEGFGLWVNPDDPMRFSLLTEEGKDINGNNILIGTPLNPMPHVGGYTTVFAIWRNLQKHIIINKHIPMILSP